MLRYLHHALFHIHFHHSVLQIIHLPTSSLLNALLSLHRELGCTSRHHPIYMTRFNTFLHYPCNPSPPQRNLLNYFSTPLSSRRCMHHPSPNLYFSSFLRVQSLPDGFYHYSNCNHNMSLRSTSSPLSFYQHYQVACKDLWKQMLKAPS